MATSGQPARTGIEVIFPDPTDVSASKKPIKVEIVAIPGIGPREDWSWTLGKSDWLKMLGKKIPGARISIFHYDPNLSNQGSIDQRLEAIAEDLLNGLNRVRRVVSPIQIFSFVISSSCFRRIPKWLSFLSVILWAVSCFKKPS